MHTNLTLYKQCRILSVYLWIYIHKTRVKKGPDVMDFREQGGGDMWEGLEREGKGENDINIF